MEKGECPFCLSNIDDIEDFVICDGCSSKYHRECWEENGGCCKQECYKAIIKLDIDIIYSNTDKLVLSKEQVEASQPYVLKPNKNPCLKCGKDVPENELYCSNCIPESEGSEDAKNLGPILIMLVIALLFLVWFFIGVIQPSQGS